MNRRVIFGALGAMGLAGILGVAVHAQSGPHVGFGHGFRGAMGFGGFGHGGMGGDHLARVDEHMGDLKAMLRIAPEQEADWAAFTNDIKERVARLEKQHAEARDANENLKAPERLERFASRLKSHEADLDGAIESFKRLYSSLNAEQQSLLDRLVAHRGHGPRRG